MSTALSMAAPPEKPRRTPLQVEWDRLLFAVKRSVRYHTCRRDFFERWSFITNFLVILVGSGTGVSALIGQSPVATAVLGFIVAALSAADLVLGYSTKARLYHDLAREFIRLERDMIPIRMDPTEEDMNAFSDRRLAIEENEPPKLSLLDTLCHNEVSLALGRRKGIVQVPWLKSIFCQYYNFHPGKCEPLNGASNPPPPSRPEVPAQSPA